MIFGEWDEEEFRKVMKREAFEDGMEEGVSIGAQQNARENARNLLTMHLGTPEQISQAVSLPLEEVLALREELDRETVAQ